MYKKESRLINNRPIVFIACSLFIGLTFWAVFRNHFMLLLATLGVLIVASAICLFINRNNRLTIYLLVIAMGIMLAMFAYLGSEVDEYKGHKFVEGRVVGEAKASNDYLYAYRLKDVKIHGADTKRQVLVYTNSSLNYGDIIFATGEVESFNYNPFDSYSMSFYNRSINYKLKADNIHKVAYKKPHILSRISLKIKDNYITNMGDKAGGVATALVFGDTTLLDKGIENSIRDSGLSHIFSVSGLHIAFMAGLVFFICRFLRVRRTLSLIVVAIVVLIYGIMAEFPASMLRAIVMLFVMLIGQFSFRRYDALSGLAGACIIIILFRPLSLFELGFQMSVSAMLGIICFYKPLKSAFMIKKGKIINYLASSFALSLSAMSIMFAVIVNTFSSFGLYFCLGNLILIPFVGLAFSWLMFATILSLIIPPLSVVLIVFKPIFLSMAGVTTAISSLPYASVATNKIGIFAIIYALTMIFMSKFIMLSKKYKYRVLAVASSLSLVLYIIINI